MIKAKAVKLDGKFIQNIKLVGKKLVFFAVAPVFLTSCQVPSFFAYKGSTTQAQAEYKLYTGFNLAAMIVGIFVWALILWSIFRYRRRKGDESMPAQFHEHRFIEFLYTIIPLITVLVLFYFTVITENQVDAVSTTPNVRVTIVAFQWGWEFKYMNSSGNSVIATVYGNDGGGNFSTSTVPVAYLPVGETVTVTLESLDVVHGFYVPEFNFSRYAQPGHINTFDLNIVNAGYYPGRCSQFCGVYHTEMQFGIKAVSPQKFESWLKSHSSAPTK